MVTAVVRGRVAPEQEEDDGAQQGHQVERVQAHEDARVKALEVATFDVPLVRVGGGEEKPAQPEEHGFVVEPAVR